MAIEAVPAFRVVSDDGEVMVSARHGCDGVDITIASYGRSSAITLSWGQVDGIENAIRLLRKAG